MSGPGKKETYVFENRLIISNVDGIRDKIDRLFESDADEILFNLQNVKECDSHGLKLLMHFRRRAENSGKKLIIYKPSVTLKELLTVTKLSEVLTIREDDAG